MRVLTGRSSTSTSRSRRRARTAASAESSVTSMSISSTEQRRASSTRPTFEPSATTIRRLSRCEHPALDLGLGQVDVRHSSVGVDAVAAEEHRARVDLVERERAERVDERVLERAQRAAEDDDREARDRRLELERDVDRVREDSDVVQILAVDQGARDRRRRRAHVEDHRVAAARRARAAARRCAPSRRRWPPSSPRTSARRAGPAPPSRRRERAAHGRPPRACRGRCERSPRRCRTSRRAR